MGVEGAVEAAHWPVPANIHMMTKGEKMNVQSTAAKPTITTVESLGLENVGSRGVISFTCWLADGAFNGSRDDDVVMHAAGGIAVCVLKALLVFGFRDLCAPLTLGHDGSDDCDNRHFAFGYLVFCKTQHIVRDCVGAHDDCLVRLECS